MTTLRGRALLFPGKHAHASVGTALMLSFAPSRSHAWDRPQNRPHAGTERFEVFHGHGIISAAGFPVATGGGFRTTETAADDQEGAIRCAGDDSFGSCSPRMC